MRTLTQHAIGIFWCSIGAAAIGFGALLLFGYGFWSAPASISRRFIHQFFDAVHSVVMAFYAPVSWFMPVSGSHPWLGGVIAAFIWGTAFYAIFRLTILAARHISSRRAISSSSRSSRSQS